MSGVDDVFDAMRRELVPEMPNEAAEAVGRGETTWDTAGLQRDFIVLGFAAPFVIVVRKADSVRGTLLFQHQPRLYFGFEPE